jgi:predicted MFS family arabinose efflux permease
MDTRLLWLGLGTFVGSAESFMVGALLPGIADTYGVLVSQAASIVVAYSVAHGIGTPVLTSLLGHHDRRNVLVAFELLVALGALLMAVAPTLLWLTAARLGLGIMTGVFTAYSLALAVALSSPETRGRAVSLVIAGQSGAVLIGVPLASLVAGRFGWQVNYIVLAGLAVAAAVAIRLRLPKGIAGSRQSLIERLRVLRIPRVRVGLAVTACFMLAAFVPLVFIAPMLTGAFGLDRSFLPVLLLVNGLGAVAGSNIGGRLADRFGARRMTIAMSWATAALLVLLWAATGLPRPLADPVFFVLMGLIGLAGWAFWPAQNSLLGSLAVESAPMILSLNVAAVDTGVALAAAVGGPILDHAGAPALVLVAAPFALLAALLAGSLQPELSPAPST